MKRRHGEMYSVEAMNCAADSDTYVRSDRSMGRK